LTLPVNPAHLTCIIDSQSQQKIKGSLVEDEKLQYLRSSLAGVALETIRSLEPSNANFKKAMNLLVNRFDNKVLHFQAHV